jgi:hypothetical protein
MSQDWKKYFQEQQHLDEHLYQPNEWAEIYKKDSYDNNWLHKQRKQQFRQATGLGACAFLTKVGFTYLGGMYQARKQFINSPFYFRNHYFNWIYGAKYMAIGLVIGTLFSTFAFGHPYLLEDFIRSKFRGLTTSQFMERGYQPM